MIRCVIADDHTILREGLKQLLSNDPDIRVIGEASDGPSVMQAVRSLEFEVLVLDMSMPGKSGLDLIRWVKAERPKLRILVLTMHDEGQYAIRSIRAGASGYLTKESAASKLVMAIRKVAGGGAFISPEVAEQFALGLPAGHDGPVHETLSDREYQVFQRLVAGASVSDIAQGLNLSVKTVSTHKARLLQKMGMDSTAELVRYALQHGLADASGEAI
jgi:DNA-binding NarL/FixJ family response regulator